MGCASAVVGPLAIPTRENVGALEYELVPLNVRVLIIGSLFWDEKRRAWRGARLDIKSAQAATAPG